MVAILKTLLDSGHVVLQPFFHDLCVVKLADLVQSRHHHVVVLAFVDARPLPDSKLLRLTGQPVSSVSTVRISQTDVGAVFQRYAEHVFLNVVALFAG
jgi:hypothetical protein